MKIKLKKGLVLHTLVLIWALVAASTLFPPSDSQAQEFAFGEGLKTPLKELHKTFRIPLFGGLHPEEPLSQCSVDKAYQNHPEFKVIEEYVLADQNYLLNQAKNDFQDVLAISALDEAGSQWFGFLACRGVWVPEGQNLDLLAKAQNRMVLEKNFVPVFGVKDFFKPKENPAYDRFNVLPKASRMILGVPDKLCSDIADNWENKNCPYIEIIFSETEHSSFFIVPKQHGISEPQGEFVPDWKSGDLKSYHLVCDS